VTIFVAAWKSLPDTLFRPVTMWDLDPRGPVFRARTSFFCARREVAPDDAGERQTEVVSLRQHLPQELWICGPVERNAARHVGGEFVESGNQPGAVSVPCALNITDRCRRRHLVPAKGVEQSGGIAAEPAQQRLARRAFDGELANSTQVAAIPIDEIEVEDLGFAVEAASMPPRAAIKPPRHLLLQQHLRRERDSGAQVHQHRVHRLGSELFGEFFGDDDVADRLTLTEPQRLQGTGPGRPSRELHVGEGLEQLLRTHAVLSLDCFVDRIRMLG